MAELQEILKQVQDDQTFGLLDSRTPDSGLDANNPRRLIRAIERAQAGEEAERGEPIYNVYALASDIPRQELYERIDKRADLRFRQGMLEEIKELLQVQSPSGRSLRAEPKSKVQRSRHFGRSEKSPALKSGIDPEMADWFLSLGLDFRVMTNYFLVNGLDAPTSGKVFDEMVQRFKFAEHDYARRQLTWWRKKEVNWVKNLNEATELAGIFLNK